MVNWQKILKRAGKKFKKLFKEDGKKKPKIVNNIIEEERKPREPDEEDIRIEMMKKALEEGFDGFYPRNVDFWDLVGDDYLGPLTENDPDYKILVNYAKELKKHEDDNDIKFRSYDENTYYTPYDIRKKYLKLLKIPIPKDWNKDVKTIDEDDDKTDY